MKKLLVGAAALGLLSGAALAEPQKLDDSLLGGVAGGVDIDASTTSMWSLMASQTSTSTTEMISSVREVSQDLTSMSVNNNYATGLASDNISAMGTSSASVMAPVSLP
jgi:hypothetical protein